jgi:hypothetical protein
MFARIRYHAPYGLSSALGVLTRTRQSSIPRCEVSQAIQIQLSPSAITRPVNATTLCVSFLNIPSRLLSVKITMLSFIDGHWEFDHHSKHSSQRTRLPSVPCRGARSVRHLRKGRKQVYLYGYISIDSVHCIFLSALSNFVFHDLDASYRSVR